jgi:RimJ/RimL family protein N-acetyltransferase
VTITENNPGLFSSQILTLLLNLFFPLQHMVQSFMMILRPLRNEDIPRIKAWPQYPPEFADLDYCLRDGGWLDEYRGKPGTEILVAVEMGAATGFTLISRNGSGCAEFRIALHPGWIGKGMGRIILRRTLEYCFADMSISQIRLIVRKNNLRAQKLYTSFHFRPTGECVEEIAGKPVQFFTMEIDRRTFFLENKS